MELIPGKGWSLVRGQESIGVVSDGVEPDGVESGKGWSLVGESDKGWCLMGYRSLMGWSLAGGA